MLPSDPTDHRIAYVCKMYPRFSETFIVSEVLAREAAGEAIDIVSLRAPADGRFHASLAEVRASVTYLDDQAPRSKDLWATLQDLVARGVDAHALQALYGASVRDAAQAIQLAGLIEDRGITHLHAHFGSVATTVARLAATLAGVTYSFTAHAKDIFHESVDPDDLRTKLADAHHVVTVSDYNARFLAERYGSAADGVRRVYNGLQLERFPFTAPAEERPTDVVAVGRLVQKKGFDVLVEACRLARDRGRPLRCRIIGSGPEHDRLRDRIDAADLGDLVELVGPLPQDRVRDEIAGAAVFAAPCVIGDDGNADGLPTVILEAMALGTPVVATDVTGIPEAVVEGHTGRIVGQHDAAELADTLVQLRDDAGQRAHLAVAARELIERSFSSAGQAEHLRSLLPVRSPATSAVA